MGQPCGSNVSPPVATQPIIESEYLAAEDLDAFGPFGDASMPGEQEEVFPIRDREWRREFAHPLAEEYCNIVDQDFPILALETAVGRSTLLMEEVGSYWVMSRHIQEVQMRKKECAREYLESQRHLFLLSLMKSTISFGLVLPHHSLKWELLVARKDCRIKEVRVWISRNRYGRTFATAKLSLSTPRRFPLWNGWISPQRIQCSKEILTALIAKNSALSLTSAASTIGWKKTTPFRPEPLALL